MTKIFNDIKSAYENKVVRDFFTVDYVTAKGNYHIRFCNDCGKWDFRICESNYPYADGDYIYVSDPISKGNKLTDSALYKVAETIKSLNL